jgi:5-methylcytosine-specific restriction endonuclease McrA
VSNRGRSGRRWRELKEQVHARRAPCCRCGQPIDYSLPYLDEVTGAPDLRSRSVDHYPHPLRTHPHLAEDPANLASAHLGCNLEAGDRRNTGPGLGDLSEDW